MTMTNEKLTNIVVSQEKRILTLEEHVKTIAKNCCKEDPIEPPIEPPVPPIYPPTPPNEGEIIDIDMTRAYHIDKKIGAGETLVFRFEFAGGVPGSNSYTQFTAVQPYSSEGCFTMFIPAYGYGNVKCGYEKSNGVGTNDRYTDWVVPVNKEIFLHVMNMGKDATLRLKCNGENFY